jgi:predicted aldo/keto reductase-like oxidoreductase
MTEKYLGESIPKLRFGYMRLPLRDGSFDEEAVNEMVDEFLSHGFSYFDTATGYSYMLNTGAKSAKPGECARCGECERHCPQHIKIPDILAKIVDALEPVRSQFVIRTEAQA